MAEDDVLTPADRYRQLRGNPFYQAGDPPPPNPDMPTKVFGGDMPEGFSMIGGLYGAQLGARGGAWGLAIGGVLGAGAGYYAGESTLDGVAWMQSLGLIGRNKVTVPPRPSLRARTIGAIEEMTIDMGATVLTPMFPLLIRGGKWLVKKALGVGGQATEAAVKEGADFGIEMAAIDVTDSRIMSFFPRVLGRWPLIAGAFRKRAIAHGEEITTAKDRMFLSLGPSANMADMGVDISRAVDSRFNGFLNLINKKYQDALALGIRSNATVSSRHIYDVATAIDAKYHARLARRVRDKPDLRAYNNHPVVRLLHQNTHKAVPAKRSKSIVLVNLLGQRVDMRQYEALADIVDRKLASKNLDIFDREQLSALKAAIERSILSIDDAATGVAFRQADDLYGKLMVEIWGTPTAKKAVSISKARFRVGGNTKLPTADKSFEAMFDVNSPQGMRDLRAMIGPERFDRTVAVHLNRTFDQALKSGEKAIQEGAGNAGLDIGVLRRAWGLDSPTSPRRAALEAALKGSAIPYERLERFVNVIEKTLANAAPDVNSFVARGMVLGGIGRLRGLLLPGAGVAGGGLVGGQMGIITGVSIITAFRGFAAIISSPRLFRATELALDNTANLQRRRAAALVVLKAIEGEVKEQPKPTIQAVDRPRVDPAREPVAEPSLTVVPPLRL
jgi:hypothetical protein